MEERGDRSVISLRLRSMAFPIKRISVGGGVDHGDTEDLCILSGWNLLKEPLLGGAAGRIINSDETAKTPQRGNGTIDSRRSLETES